MSIINKDAPLKVKHLLWAMGIFQSIIVAGIAFGLWYVGKDVEKAVEPLQTKEAFNEWQKSDQQEWGNWKEKEWSPHIKESVNASVSIGILLDRTDSRAENTNSVGRRNGTIATQPPTE